MPAEGARDSGPSSLRVATAGPSGLDVDAILAHEAPTRDLLLYYRSKVLGFAAEREHFLQRLETLERLASSDGQRDTAAPRSPEVGTQLDARARTNTLVRTSVVVAHCSHRRTN